MARFYLPKETWNPPSLVLKGDEARHAVKVLRLREGDKCTVFDGEGRAVVASISAILSQQEIVLEIVEECPAHSPLPEITLCQSVPKGGNMDLIIQKAVELGAARIIPLITEHTVVRIAPAEAEAKRAKWERTALEACKQCGRNTLPVIEQPQAFHEWLNCFTLPGTAVIASLAPGARPIREELEQARKNGSRSAALLVGPEGDFSEIETAAALAKGFAPVTLGPIVLRVETATFFGLAALRYSLD